MSNKIVGKSINTVQEANNSTESLKKPTEDLEVARKINFTAITLSCLFGIIVLYLIALWLKQRIQSY